MRSIEELRGDEKFREAFDRCKKTLERWHDRFTFQNLALTKRYLKGEIRLYVQLTLPPDGPRPLESGVVKVGGLNNALVQTLVSRGVDLCAVSNHSPVVGMQSYGHEVTLNASHIEALDLASREGQVVMLVGVVVIPNHPELIADLKGLYFVEDFERRFSPALFFSLKSGFQTFGAADSGEIILPSISSAASGAFPKMVKRDMEIVNGIGDDSTPPKCVDVLNDTDAKATHVHRVTLHVHVSEHSIRAAFPEGTNFGFEVTDVLVGPIDLDPTAGRPFSVGAAQLPFRLALDFATISALRIAISRPVSSVIRSGGVRPASPGGLIIGSVFSFGLVSDSAIIFPHVVTKAVILGSSLVIMAVSESPEKS